MPALKSMLEIILKYGELVCGEDKKPQEIILIEKLVIVFLHLLQLSGYLEPPNCSMRFYYYDSNKDEDSVFDFRTNYKRS